MYQPVAKRVPNKSRTCKFLLIKAKGEKKKQKTKKTVIVQIWRHRPTHSWKVLLIQNVSQGDRGFYIYMQRGPFPHTTLSHDYIRPAEVLLIPSIAAKHLSRDVTLAADEDSNLCSTSQTLRLHRLYHQT